MSPVGILMFIFATVVLLVGIYMATGHKLEIMTWRAAFRNLSISDWKSVGKGTIIASVIIYIISILCFIFNLG